MKGRSRDSNRGFLRAAAFSLLRIMPAKERLTQASSQLAMVQMLHLGSSFVRVPKRSEECF